MSQTEMGKSTGAQKGRGTGSGAQIWTVKLELPFHGDVQWANGNITEEPEKAEKEPERPDDFLEKEPPGLGL